MRVTALIENRSSKTIPGLVAEWGLALHIKFNAHSILFDSGSSGAFVRNADGLSIQLEDIDAAVLSHHHFDHGGGLRRFLEVNKKALVHLGMQPNGECFTRILWFIKKYVGLEETLITDFPDRFKTLNQPAEILPGVFVFPNISAASPRPVGNKSLFLRKNGKLVPDDFSHEIVMAIKENNHLVVFTGCSHSGVLNMIDTVAQAFDGIPIKAVVGGFHLISSPLFNSMAGSKSEVEELANKLLKYPIEQTYTGHCTGKKAFAVLNEVMGDRVLDIMTGTSFEV